MAHARTPATRSAVLTARLVVGYDGRLSHCSPMGGRLWLTVLHKGDRLARWADAMFDNLSDKIQATFRKITGKTKITEEHVDEALREIRLALLEADVNFKVVKKFLDDVREKALGQEITKGLKAGQQLVKIVHDELVETLGGTHQDLHFRKAAPHVVMMVGLQGSGKTTSCAKLARILAREDHQPLLVPCDVYRPAAILQLQTVGEQVNVPVFDSTGMDKPVQIVRAARKQAQENGQDVLLIDTAGRLHIDDELMAELNELKAVLAPDEILFVADAMTGQDAVQSAGAFHGALELTGVIVTKLDGDARGGAALSVKQVTGCPIKFAGTGEKLDDFERFHPDRLASRILGMGDVLSLVEQVQDKVDQEEAMALQKRMLKDQFTLDDFAKSLKQMGKMGDLGKLMGMMPGMSGMRKKVDLQAEQHQLKGIQAMIASMTPEERTNHAILNNSRKARIARGSGQSVESLNQMLKQFQQMKQMMSLMTKPGKIGKLRQLFNRAGMGEFARHLAPSGAPRLPEGMTQEQLMQMVQENDGQLPPDVARQMGLMGAPRASSPEITRKKKDRKKQKAMRKKGRKKK